MTDLGFRALALGALALLAMAVALFLVFVAYGTAVDGWERWRARRRTWVRVWWLPRAPVLVGVRAVARPWAGPWHLVIHRDVDGYCYRRIRHERELQPREYSPAQSCSRFGRRQRLHINALS